MHVGRYLDLRSNQVPCHGDGFSSFLLLAAGARGSTELVSRLLRGGAGSKVKMAERDKVPSTFLGSPFIICRLAILRQEISSRYTVQDTCHLRGAASGQLWQDEDAPRALTFFCEAKTSYSRVVRTWRQGDRCYAASQVNDMLVQCECGSGAGCTIYKASKYVHRYTCTYLSTRFASFGVLRRRLEVCACRR